MDVRADSHAHCEQVMEEELDYRQKTGGNVLIDTQTLIAQLRQRFNSMIAVSESKREQSIFFGDREIATTLGQPKWQRTSQHEVAQVIKNSFFEKMMQHNQRVASQIKARLAKRPQTAPTKNQAKAIQPSSGFKGLQTLQMLEKTLGIEETKEQKPTADETGFEFYSSAEFLATSEGFGAGANYVHSIQEQYMKQLDDQYKFLQNTKKAKMLQVVNACRRIQRYWRAYKRRRILQSAITIQRHVRYQQLLRRKKWASAKQSKLGKVRRMIAGLKIKRWLVAIYRRRRYRLKVVRKYPQSFIPILVRMQAVVRGYLVRKSMLNTQKQICLERKHIRRNKAFKKYFRLQKPIAVLQSKQMSVLAEQQARRETLDEYMVKIIAEFEAGWLVHELKLKKYELTQAKLVDWEERKTAEGTVWVNLKNGEHTKQHPGFHYFKLNRKTMRKRAEEKFQKDVVSPVEQERESLEIQSEKRIAALLRDIVSVYKFNVHKIYFNR